MKVLIHLFILATIYNFSPIQAQEMKDFKTIFEQSNNQSANYDETISFYKRLAKAKNEVNILEVGLSDIGRPIHLVIISEQGLEDVNEIDRSQKTVLLINNAIHPGEPCGIDASMKLSRDIVFSPELNKLLKNTIILIIPIYNISGALNRTSFSRANQSGPEKYGFRGNIRNLDLNRDFVKSISKNAQTFNQIFAKWKPDVMIDNHTSNGADYQYTMTLLATHKDKLASAQSILLTEHLLPYLYNSMKDKKWPMIPYVNTRSTPDEGIYGFLDLPRYSSGYATLHHCISFMPETHMLKPYKDRVISTYEFMLSMLEYLEHNGPSIRKAKKSAQNHYLNESKFALNWNLNTNVSDKLLFKGFQAKYKKSKIHGQNRLYYDRNEPFEKEVNYWNDFIPTDLVTKPKAYIIPQAYNQVIDRLKNNGVHLSKLMVDSSFTLSMYYIDAHNTTPSAYEGRFLHYDIKLKKLVKTRQFYKGDYIVELNQKANRYIIEMLEPNAPDSYFAWGFFDGILMQKEYFSPYVFEDLAIEILKDNPEIEKALNLKKNTDPEFDKNAYKQLEFIYKRSKYFEDSYKLYPVGRID